MALTDSLVAEQGVPCAEAHEEMTAEVVDYAHDGYSPASN